MNLPERIVIKGAGDLGTGVAHRLWRSGFEVVLLELPEPLVVRWGAAFATAVFRGSWTVEGVTARLCHTSKEVETALTRREIGVLVDPEGEYICTHTPGALVDAIMAKRNTGTSRDDAPAVIALGPGFSAPGEVHAVIETQRGPDLGRVYYHGNAAKDTGVPGDVAGAKIERLLRAPAKGLFTPFKEIGDLVEKGETVAQVGGKPVIAQINGLLRGLLFAGLPVQEGMKVGDVDPRGAIIDWRAISDKARAVSGGVLEALLHLSSPDKFRPA